MSAPPAPSCGSSSPPSRRSRSFSRGSRRSWPGLRTRREADEQAAVLVVGGEEVGGHRLHVPRAGAKLEPLAEAPDAPVERDLSRVLAVEAGQAERLDHVAAHQVLLAPP